MNYWKCKCIYKVYGTNFCYTAAVRSHRIGLDLANGSLGTMNGLRKRNKDVINRPGEEQARTVIEMEGHRRAGESIRHFNVLPVELIDTKIP